MFGVDVKCNLHLYESFFSIKIFPYEALPINQSTNQLINHLTNKLFHYLSILSFYMEIIQQFLFILLAGFAIFLFTAKANEIGANIKLGHDEYLNDNKRERW